MADDTAFGKDLAPGRQLWIPGHTFAFQLAKLLAARRVFQAHRSRRFEEKLRQVIDITLVDLPIDGVLIRIADFKRLLLPEAYKKVMKRNPTLREHADVQIHARQRAPRANRVR